MLTVNCPSCGAAVTFRSPALPVKVCDYCQTAVMRIEDGVRAMGKMAVLPFDVSPIRIGTRGRFEGRAFEVIGRVRWGWSDGSWNEWLLLFGDGAQAWLGEAMGHLMLLFEATPRDLGKVRVGDEVQIDGIAYQVADSRSATCIASEGELPFTAPAGWTIHSVDFRSPSGACASFQSDGKEANFYAGRYVTLAELAPTDLRAIDGWPMPAFAA